MKETSVSSANLPLSQGDCHPAVPIISFNHLSRPQITFAIFFQIEVSSHTDGGPPTLARLNWVAFGSPGWNPFTRQLRRLIYKWITKFYLKRRIVIHYRTISDLVRSYIIPEIDKRIKSRKITRRASPFEINQFRILQSAKQSVNIIGSK